MHYSRPPISWEQGTLFPSSEVSLYQDAEAGGFFSVLVNCGDKKKQESYPVEYLSFVLDALDYSRDTWVSQATFFQKNRRIVNLKSIGLSFLDIDCYKCAWAKGLKPDAMAAKFVTFCRSEGIPDPSLIVFSGRGLQPKWLFSKAVPRMALPRWNAVQMTLLDRFAQYGADPAARDASRVLRLVQSVNTKSGEVCRIVHTSTREDGTPVRYAFDAFADAVLPCTRATVTENRKTRQKRVKTRSEREASLLTVDALNWGRLEDLRALVGLRGGIDEGMRMLMLAYQLTFLALSHQVEPSQFFLEARQIARQIDPSWSYNDKDLSTIFAKFKQHLAGHTVLFQGRKYSPLYTPKNETLIKLFQISLEEQRQLKTIISSQIKIERDLAVKESKRRAIGAMIREDYEGRADARQERARELRAKGLSIRKIAAEMGLSKTQIERYIKGVPCCSS